MTDPLEDTQALSAEEVAELTGEAEEQDETATPERVAETENTVPIESSDQLEDGVPQPFIPEEACQPARMRAWPRRCTALTERERTRANRVTSSATRRRPTESHGPATPLHRDSARGARAPRRPRFRPTPTRTRTETIRFGVGRARTFPAMPWLQVSPIGRSSSRRFYAEAEDHRVEWTKAPRAR